MKIFLKHSYTSDFFVYFSISPTKLENLRNQVVELFPSEKEYAESWYEPSTKVDRKRKRGKDPEKTGEADFKRRQVHGNRGCLYNTYKYWRKIFLEAGMVKSDAANQNVPEEASGEPAAGKRIILWIL